MNIIFICSGNICRSPMAEGILKSMLNTNTINVTSAGIQNIEDLTPSFFAVTACQRYGIDISNYKSTRLTQEIVDKNDLILCMTMYHKMAITTLFPSSKGKTFLLKEYVNPDQVQDLDIKDPYGQSEEVYNNCCDEIYECIKKLVEKIK